MSFQKLVEKETSSIPVIDFKALTIDGEKIFELEKLQFSCRDWGIFQVRNIQPTSLSQLRLFGDF